MVQWESIQILPVVSEPVMCSQRRAGPTSVNPAYHRCFFLHQAAVQSPVPKLSEDCAVEARAGSCSQGDKWDLEDPSGAVEESSLP